MSEHNNQEKDNSREEGQHSHKKETTKKPVTIDLSKILKAKVLIPIIAAIVIVGGFLLSMSQGWIFAATVNGGAISRHEVRNLVEKNGGADVLRGLISQKLIEQEIKKNKISVSSEEIDEEVAKIEKLLESQGMTFADAIESQNLTVEEARDQIERQLELEELLSEEILVSDEEVESFMNENNVPAPEDEEEGEALRESIREQIEQEKLFNEYLILEEELRSKAKIKFFVDYLDSKE